MNATRQLKEIEYQKGSLGFKYYTIWTPGLRPYKTRKMVKEALRLGHPVYVKEKD